MDVELQQVVLDETGQDLRTLMGIIPGVGLLTALLPRKSHRYQGVVHIGIKGILFSGMGTQPAFQLGLGNTSHVEVLYKATLHKPDVLVFVDRGGFRYAIEAQDLSQAIRQSHSVGLITKTKHVQLRRAGMLLGGGALFVCISVLALMYLLPG